jgi:cytochrome c-type biogenesis protein CcmE
MTRKRRRLYVLALCMLGLASATALVAAAFEDNLTYFYSPSELAGRTLPADRAFRLGGMVAEGSLDRLGDGVTVAFVVTDFADQVRVVYEGLLPDLFRECQGVVAEGRMRPDGVFQASEVLAKHDENYMPPEVAATLQGDPMCAGRPVELSAAD